MNTAGSRLIKRAALLAASAALFLTAATPPQAPPLPPLNEKVLAFARAKLGTSVGDGSCTTLAIAALKEAGAQFYPGSRADGGWTWGEPIESFKDALPGDVLQFHNAVFAGKKFVSRLRWVSWHHEYPHHTAIVAKVSAGGKQVAVLHQNVTMQGNDKDAKNVQETALPLDSLQKGGSIHIFRPVAGPPRRSRPRGEGFQPAEPEPEPDPATEP